ncbi:hypothetical protein PORY_000756 [Pneumocystis oryctolagi]|uniref:Uncharacterized protein n=1 Tax=Pneumocystis oryctolagi TaxID=42067 RepID=A0ACB7CE40_9ASCO|nr:hypothetical protein PORY_000756 [Pneumocystis oryctolagi]
MLMEFFKDPIIVQLSPIKNLASSDPSKKLRKIISYEHNKKQRRKNLKGEKDSDSNIILYKSDYKGSNEKNSKKNIKKNNLNIEQDILVLNIKTKKYNDYLNSGEKKSFSSQKYSAKNIKNRDFSNSTSPVSITQALQDEFMWDTENNISYNISSDDYSLLSLNSDYDNNKTLACKKREKSSDSWILF